MNTKLPIDIKKAGRFERGYSLVESLVLLALIGMFASITVPNGVATIANYRLNLAVTELSSALQLTRAKAVSENFDVTFDCSANKSSSHESYSIYGGEPGSGALQPWQDRNGNSVRDVISTAPEFLPSGIQIVSPKEEMKNPVPAGGSCTNTTTRVTFGSMGVPRLTSPAIVIYLRNQMMDMAAVSVDVSGSVQRWKLEGSRWLKK